jgi:hypothetical protein
MMCKEGLLEQVGYGKYRAANQGLVALNADGIDIWTRIDGRIPQSRLHLFTMRPGASLWRAFSAQ